VGVSWGVGEKVFFKKKLKRKRKKKPGGEQGENKVAKKKLR
jgi:hypothetical protein